MVKTKLRKLRSNSAYFRRLQALSACRAVYPEKYEALRKECKVEQAVAIGFNIMKRYKSFR